ncbi:Dihydropteroate synthase-like protein [Scleroderma yunnanense]
MDDIGYSIDYASVSSLLENRLPQIQYPALEELVASIFDLVFNHPGDIQQVRITAIQENSPLQPAIITYKATRTKSGEIQIPDEFILQDLRCMTLIGVHPHERTQKQPLFLDITVRRRMERKRSAHFLFCGLAISICTHSKSLNVSTLEAFALSVARHVLEFTNETNDEVTVEVAKPMALAFAKSARISITRRQDDFHLASASLRNQDSMQTKNTQTRSDLHIVAIALGSNLGDRFANIETALRLLEVPRTLLEGLDDRAEISVINTSFMYETAPMYVTDQPRFANCACMIETNLQPVVLLSLLKKIEDVVGRVPSIRNGPRAVDLDILLYDGSVIDTRPEDSRRDLENLIGELVVPHPRMAEREFVLRPLNDMIPDFVHPIYGKTVRTLLHDVVSKRPCDDPPMLKVIPFPEYPCDSAPTPHGLSSTPSTTKYWIVAGTDTGGKPTPHKTRIMATLNVTPDSFSDGSRHNTIPAALEYVTTSVKSYADIIDIGGYSTRPHAECISENEEINRVVPVIRAIRDQDNEDVRGVLISVDTFRCEVAEAAVRAGANCINDVYAFTGPDYPLVQASTEHLLKMRDLARRLCVPVILMHSRGDAGSNKEYGDYDGNLVRAIQSELGDKVDKIVRGRGGMRRWLIVVDPGFGFSKPVDAQYTLLRNIASITADDHGNHLAGYPVLVGTSKKSFLGALLQRPDLEGTYKGRKTSPKERGWATAATVACAVQQGASVVRVHDVPEMRDVVAVASAIWRESDS